MKGARQAEILRIIAEVEVCLLYTSVLEHFLEHAAQAGFTVSGLTYSPIRGPEGNIEYLGYLIVGEAVPWQGDLAQVVWESHRELEGK